jgi:hypothetical protein
LDLDLVVLEVHLGGVVSGQGEVEVHLGGVVSGQGEVEVHLGGVGVNHHHHHHRQKKVCYRHQYRHQ